MGAAPAGLPSAGRIFNGSSADCVASLAVNLDASSLGTREQAASGPLKLGHASLCHSHTELWRAGRIEPVRLDVFFDGAGRSIADAVALCGAATDIGAADADQRHVHDVLLDRFQPGIVDDGLKRG